jgi:hypothetical protein
VSNSLFIRSYPAHVGKLVPVAFGPGVGGYFLVCLVPLWCVGLFSGALYELKMPPTWVHVALAFSLLCLLLALAYLRRLRLEITTRGISYRSLLGGTKFIAYGEMSTVVLVNWVRAHPEQYAGDAPPRRTLIITPNPESGKSRIRIPLTFFPSRAEEELMRLLQPAVWDSGD